MSSLVRTGKKEKDDNDSKSDLNHDAHVVDKMHQEFLNGTVSVL